LVTQTDGFQNGCQSMNSATIGYWFGVSVRWAILLYACTQVPPSVACVLLLMAARHEVDAFTMAKLRKDLDETTLALVESLETNLATWKTVAPIVYGAEAEREIALLHSSMTWFTTVKPEQTH
jgi:hypothetical protein